MEPLLDTAVRVLVSPQIGQIPEGLVAQVASIRTFIGVYQHVLGQPVFKLEPFITFGAHKIPIISMASHVLLQKGCVRESFAANIADGWQCSRVTHHMGLKIDQHFHFE